MFWDVLQRTLKEDLEITAHSILFLPISTQERPPYDLIIIGLGSIWCPRITVRHADVNPLPLEAYFVKFVTQIRSTYAQQETVPEWVGECERLLKRHQSFQ